MRRRSEDSFAAKFLVTALLVGGIGLIAVLAAHEQPLAGTSSTQAGRGAFPPGEQGPPTANVAPPVQAVPPDDGRAPTADQASSPDVTTPGPASTATHSATAGQPPDNPGPAAPGTVGPAAARPPVAMEPAPAGEGSPSQFITNRRALLRCGDKTLTIPGTFWFDRRAAPEGDTPFTFNIKHGGSGHYDFFFAGDRPVEFTDADGNPLAVIDVKFSVEDLSGGRLRCIFKLSLAKP